VPGPWHGEWVIGNICEEIYIKGTLGAAKDVLDNLIQPTPDIPLYVQLNIQPRTPTLTVNEFKALKPSDLIRVGEFNELIPDNLYDFYDIFLVEHVLPEYPTPNECRIYARRQGGKDHGKLRMFQLADHKNLKFFRRIRKAWPVLRELIRCLEQAEEPDYEMACSVGISRAQVECLRDTVINRPELVPPLLDGTLSLDDVC
jgi:hypothetical protein